MLPKTHFCGIARAVAVLQLTAWSVLGGWMATANPLNIDIPRGYAIITLKEIADQTGIQIMYSDAAVEGIVTNAVHGSYQPEKALYIMLEDTGLEIVQTQSNTIYGVRVNEHIEPVISNEDLNPKADSSMKNIQNNRKPNNTLFATLLAGLIGSTGSVVGQDDLADDDILLLSPFVVDAAEQDGYVASTTLAGTRLNTRVEDLGAAISIYTEEFVEDIGATNGNELLIYAVGIEAGGSQGNFAASGANTAGIRTNPQNAVRTRGLAAPSLTRGLFVTNIGFDSYNTTSVTVNRGPNGILFGIGSPAGIIDASVKQASLYDNFGDISFRIGDNNSFRSTLDVNRTLLEDKLAVRIALLYDEERFDQNPAFDIDERFFATFTFKPTENTTLRANFEDGEIYANRPINVLPLQGYSDIWLNGGRPTNDWTFWDDPSRNPNAASQLAQRERDNSLIGQRDFFLRPGFIYNDGSIAGAGPDSGIMGVVQNSANRAGRIRPGIFHPTANQDSANDVFQWLATRNINTVAGSQFPGGERPLGIVPQGFTDYSVFPFNEQMLDETARQFNDFYAANVALEHLILDGNAGVEVAYDKQEYNSDGQIAFVTNGGSNQIRIDVNERLQDGTPNPNVGRPYLVNASGTQNNQSIGRETYRVTAFFKFDFADINDKWGSWLGRHTVTGLWERNEIDNLNYDTRFTSNFIEDSALSPAFQSGSRTPSPIVYLGPSILDGSDVRLNPIRVAPFVDGTSVSTRYFAATPNDLSQGEFINRDITAIEYTRQGQYTNEVIESQAIVLQSYWLNDLIVTTFGWRKDTSEARAFALPQTLDQTSWSFDDFDLSGNEPNRDSGKPTSMGIVLKWPEQLISLPEGTSFSLFYNESDNFTPAGTRINPYGDNLTSPSGETKDYGFNLSINEGQFNVRFNLFETASVNNSFNPGNVLSRATRDGSIQLANFWADDLNDVDENGNPAPIDRRADFQRILDAMPPNYAEVYSWTGFVQDDAGLWFANFTAPGGITDTQDFTAEGMELELVYNPTNNWRILANVARQETVRTNVAPWTQDAVNRLTPVWNALADEPRGAYPDGFAPGDTLPDGTVTVGSWILENVTVPLAATLANEGLPNNEQREWRFNIVTNYKFTEGVLEGFNVGGAYRWQDEVGIGFPFERDANGNVVAVQDSPYTAPAESNFDFFMGYQRRIMDDKINWKLQLNMKNVFGDDDPIPVTSQYDGTPATVRIPPEKRIYLTSTFEF